MSCSDVHNLVNENQGQAVNGFSIQTSMYQTSKRQHEQQQQPLLALDSLKLESNGEYKPVEMLVEEEEKMAAELATMG